MGQDSPPAAAQQEQPSEHVLASTAAAVVSEFLASLGAMTSVIQAAFDPEALRPIAQRAEAALAAAETLVRPALPAWPNRDFLPSATLLLHEPYALARSELLLARSRLRSAASGAATETASQEVEIAEGLAADAKAEYMKLRRSPEHKAALRRARGADLVQRRARLESYELLDQVRKMLESRGPNFRFLLARMRVRIEQPEQVAAWRAEREAHAIAAATHKAAFHWRQLRPGGAGVAEARDHYRSLAARSTTRRFDLGRLDYMANLGPDGTYLGRDQWHEYVVFVFREQRLLVLECPVVGNASYSIWSGAEGFWGMKKKEILAASYSNVERIVHSARWRQQLGAAMASRGNR